MKHNLQHSFQDAVSFDDGETIEVVTVGYDHLPEEINYPHDHNFAEMFDGLCLMHRAKTLLMTFPMTNTSV